MEYFSYKNKTKNYKILLTECGVAIGNRFDFYYHHSLLLCFILYNGTQREKKISRLVLFHTRRKGKRKKREFFSLNAKHRHDEIGAKKKGQSLSMTRVFIHEWN